MPVIKLGDLTTFTGDTSGSWLVINDPTNTATYKAQKEQLLSGSFSGTASFAQNSATASYVDASNVVGLNLSQIASGSATASIQPGLLNVNTDTNIQGNLTASNLLTQGTITAQTLLVQYITASTELVTGSTKFGTQLTDTHQFTGSVSVTGSLLATSSWSQNANTASFAVTASFLTGQVVSASYAISASYAQTSSVASYSKIQESQYRFQNFTVLDQDIWLNSSDIYKIVTSSGVSTLEYKINAGSYTALTFTGNTWTGSVSVNPNDQLSWRITYRSGYTTAAFVVVSNITIN